MRTSGILMHITSLPGPYGVGTMGANAHAFIDFLKKAGQSVWQLLPLTPTSYGDSPYQSVSSYAGNPYLIDLDMLAEEGLLKPEELSAVCWCSREDKVDYGLLYQHRWEILRKAFGRFADWEELDHFCEDNADWLPDYTLFMALKERHGGAPWYQWEKPLKHRDPDALWQCRKELKEQLRFHSFVQYLFEKQWQALRSYANENGISIIGDVPIYVPLDSADIWAAPDQFQLDEKLTPTAVAGCPPDAFSEDGQLWGNPLYDWEAMEADGFSWWLRRLAAAGMRYDTVRLDHFRGFEAYWSVPYGETTAKNGQWIKGPGMKLLGKVKQALPGLDFIAEDLGFLTEEVLELRRDFGYPGMKVLQFAFDTLSPSEYQPHMYYANTVCYTGTHDNMTMAQWFETTTPEIREYAAKYMALTEEEGYVWGSVRTVMASVSDLCVVQLQDVLGLGAEGRMNFPGTTTDCNWTWRAAAGCCTDELARKLRELTELYDRLGSQN